MNNKPKNREWVKTAAIIFLTVLLVLTFFSNTINNRLLPEVATVAVTDGSITAKVRATGKVSAIGNNEVKATGTRTVAAVKVKEGQEVNEGDVLFVMGSAADDELEAAVDARDSAYFGVKRAKTSYPVDTSSYSLNAAYTSYLDALQNEEIAWNQYMMALDHSNDPNYINIANQLSTAQAQLESLNIQLEQYRASLQLDMNSAEQAYYDRYAYWQMLPDGPEKDIALAEANFAYQTFLSAQQKYQDSFLYTDPYVQQITELENTINALEIQLSSFDNDASAMKAKYDAALSARNSAEQAYTSAQASHAASQASLGQQSAAVAIDVEEAELNLDKKQAKVNSLSGEGEDANVYAKVSGIVETVNYSSGDTVTKDDVMCIIEVPDQGYTMSASVTKDQASRLKVGDSAAASNYYWGKTITATISSIKSDPKDPQGKRLITFDVEGDVTSGQELTVSVGQKSASYDIIVPKSAVMSDNNGNFVLVITSKSSALGNRYFAKRVDIEVLAEDDTSRAISGDLGNGDFVITNSSTKINSGDQVRLADNS